MQVIIFIIAVVLSSCASAPSAPSAEPDWLARGLEAVYPSSRYIAQEGRGATRAAAEADALAAISRYFNAEVSSTVRVTVIGTNTTSSERVYIDDMVKSNTRLFAVRYAEAYYDPLHKEYRTAAYIDREEAWAIFAPRVGQEAEGFRALWANAETESVPLKIFFLYKSLQNYINRADYINTLGFGEVLSPAKTSAIVRDVREHNAQIAAKLNEARNMASVFVECKGDEDAIITGAITRLLSADGFVVASAKSNASAICSVTINGGYQKLEAGHFYTPSASVTISGKNGAVLFSYSTQAGRVGATSDDVAKRRSYNALAAALERNFIAELSGTVVGYRLPVSGF